MERMTPAERQALINAIALREGTTRELAKLFDATPAELRQFVAGNLQAIEAAKRRAEDPVSAVEAADVVTPTQLEELWITNKFQRLKRLQAVAEETYNSITQGAMVTPAEQAMAVREFRSYLMLAANELGQLLHRGSGDAGTGDSLNIEIAGVDMNSLM